MCARFGIADGTLPGKLVTLLAVFAPALPVALPGDHRAARAFAAEIARRETQVDQRQAVFNAFRLVLNAPRMQHNGAIGLGKQSCCAFDGLGRYSCLFSAQCAGPTHEPIPLLVRIPSCT